MRPTDLFYEQYAEPDALLRWKATEGERNNFGDLAVFDKYYYLNVVKCAVGKSHVFSYKV